MFEFFEGRSILLTGATGFVGKAVLEKILRCLNGVQAVYILVREKRGESSQSRLQRLLENSVFDRLRQDQQEIGKKIIALSGCLRAKNLGLSNVDLDRIRRNVSIVIHTAANVNFEASLSDTVRDNVWGTAHVVNVCKDIKNLTSVVYVSTAYANYDTTDPNIKEEVYPSRQSYIKLMELETSTTPTSIGSKPNNYMYSKAIAENVFQMLTAEFNIPSCIVRPSIVCCSAMEPSPGWLDGYGGFNGSLLAVMSGLCNTFLCNPDLVMDTIPVDIVVNVVLAAAWNTAVDGNICKVYNCVSGPFTSKKLKDYLNDFIDAATNEYPLEQAIFYPDIQLTDSKIWWYLFTVWKQYLPAFIVDTVSAFYSTFTRLRRTNSKPFLKLMKVQIRIVRVQLAQRYFTTKQWSFDTDNLTALGSMLKTKIPIEYQNQWELTTRNVNWNKYVQDFCHGIRLYLAKEPDSSLPHAKRRIYRLYLIRKVFQIVTLIAIGSVYAYLSEYLDVASKKVFYL